MCTARDSNPGPAKEIARTWRVPPAKIAPLVRLIPAGAGGSRSAASARPAPTAETGSDPTGLRAWRLSWRGQVGQIRSSSHKKSSVRSHQLPRSGFSIIADALVHNSSTQPMCSSSGSLISYHMRDSDTLPLRMWSGAGGPTSPRAVAGAHRGAALICAAASGAKPPDLSECCGAKRTRTPDMTSKNWL
jgi:hypothetical protein